MKVGSGAGMPDQCFASSGHRCPALWPPIRKSPSGDEPEGLSLWYSCDSKALFRTLRMSKGFPVARNFKPSFEPT